MVCSLYFIEIRYEEAEYYLAEIRRVKKYIFVIFFFCFNMSSISILKILVDVTAYSARSNLM
jgi:hypothetical protein